MRVLLSAAVEQIKNKMQVSPGAIQFFQHMFILQSLNFNLHLLKDVNITFGKK
jgi:hypothetical protein